MAEPAWLTYTGAIAGAIGAVTGVAGAIMGFISYRKTNEIKELELRLELRRRTHDLHAVLSELPELLRRAERSHVAVAAATGKRGSGAMVQWSQQWETDQGEVKSIADAAPPEGQDLIALTLTELEQQLASVHQVHARAVTLRDRYIAALAADDRERDHLREDMRAVTQAKLEKS